MKKAVIAICAAFISFSTACAANDAQDFQYARSLTRAGNYLAATRFLRNIQKHHPNDVIVLCELGCSYERNFDDGAQGLDNAQKCFERALQLDPQCGRAYYGMAMCYNSRGNFAKGVEMSTMALTVKRPELDGLRERAGALSNLKRDKDALADIELYIKKKTPLEREVIVQKATILENLKRFDLALNEYRALLKTHYEDSLVYREVACLQALHRPEEAVRSLNNLIKKNKQDDSSYLTRARLYESMGKHNEAVADYSSAIDLQPSTTALKERAAVYQRIGRKDLAEKDRRDAERI